MGTASSLAERLAHFRKTYPPSSRDLAGVHLRFIDTGAGADPILYFPGGTGEAEASFDYILQLAGDHRVIAISYPEIDRMDALSDAVSRLLDDLGLGPVHVWGTSIGGMVAQRFALRHPERVRSVVLSNTSAPDPARATQIRRQAKLSRLLPGAIERGMLRKAFGRLLEGTSPSDRAFWEGYLNENFLGDHAGKLRTMNALSLDFYENAALFDGLDAAWAGRTLIIEAKDDQLYGSTHERLVALYPRAEVVSFEHGGHATTVSQSTLYVEAVQRFLT